MTGRTIIIGGGHNGLVAAYYLAKAGMRPLVLERREVVGGACVTEEFHPGFRCSPLANSTGPLLPEIASDLQLAQHGLEIVNPPVRAFAPSADGCAISLYEDTQRTVDELTRLSAHDARNYPDFLTSFARIGRALSPLLRMTPPSIDKPAPSELWHLGKLGLAIRGLGKKDEYRLLRYGPMAVADLAAEWFENETLRAVVAARGIFGAFAGPWSAGTSTALLLQAAIGGSPIAPSTVIKGGMGALSKVIAEAAQQAGAEIRTNVEVVSIQITDGRATGVVLANGEEIPAQAVVSNLNPASTFLNLTDPGELEPGFVNKIRNYRTQGAVAKVHLALAGLPMFTALKDALNSEKLSGQIHIGPNIDYLERAFDAAKYGDFSPSPYLNITIPTITDPSLAPGGAHVMSIHAQFAPYTIKQSDWNSEREKFGDQVIETLAVFAPNLKELIVNRRVITPLELEQEYGLRSGHIHHGEMSLDQLFTFRPLIGWAQYRTPIKGLYLCGAGTHPGAGVTGACGANAGREVIKDLQR